MSPRPQMNLNRKGNGMSGKGRRVVTGHDASGKSVILSDGPPPQAHPMSGPDVGADFIEIWNSGETVPTLTATPASEPNARPFTIMPPAAICCASSRCIRRAWAATAP